MLSAQAPEVPEVRVSIGFLNEKKSKEFVRFQGIRVASVVSKKGEMYSHFKVSKWIGEKLYSAIFSAIDAAEAKLGWDKACFFLNELSVIR